MFLFLNSLLCCSCVIRHLTVRAREPICDASEHHGVEHEHLPRRKMGVERRLLDLRRGYQLLANLVPVLPGTQRKRNPMHLRLLTSCSARAYSVWVFHWGKKSDYPTIFKPLFVFYFVIYLGAVLPCVTRRAEALETVQ
jgi:hypothetical protein